MVSMVLNGKLQPLIKITIKNRLISNFARVITSCGLSTLLKLVVIVSAVAPPRDGGLWGSRAFYLYNFKNLSVWKSSWWRESFATEIHMFSLDLVWLTPSWNKRGPTRRHHVANCHKVVSQSSHFVTSIIQFSSVPDVSVSGAACSWIWQPTIPQWPSGWSTCLQRWRWRVRAPPSAVLNRFISRIDTVFGTEELEQVCEALRELTVPCNVSGDYQ